MSLYHKGIIWALIIKNGKIIEKKRYTHIPNYCQPVNKEWVTMLLTPEEWEKIKNELPDHICFYYAVDYDEYWIFYEKSQEHRYGEEQKTPYGVREVSPEEFPIGARVTYEEGKVYEVPRGQNVYLGWQVKDRGKPGYSEPQEVLDTIKEIEEDYLYFKGKHPGYAKRILNNRTNRLAWIVSINRNFTREEKIELIKEINRLRMKYGLDLWTPSEWTMEIIGITSPEEVVP